MAPNISFIFFVCHQKRYWLVGGVIWIYERILREVRSRHRTYISKVIQHPSKVMEIQIKKEKTTTRAGQYIFLCCPEVSYFQWHPFTLTRYVIFAFSVPILSTYFRPSPRSFISTRPWVVLFALPRSVSRATRPTGSDLENTVSSPI